MRVFHLPQNIASLPSHSVRALRQAGVDASGLIFSGQPTQTGDGLEVTPQFRQSRIRRSLDQLTWFFKLAKLAHRADILHWYYGRPVLPYGLDLAWVRMLHKPALVEWMGSDIRRPEVEFADNPYYAQAHLNGYEYAKTESQGNSQHFQGLFAHSGFACATDCGLIQYIDREIYPHSYTIPRRLILDDYPPAYPESNVKKPLVFHSPTAPVAKGTAAVLKAVEQVQVETPFEFRLVEGLPRSQAMQMMQSADIVLDQFVLGDFGMAALEAMAFGKPVICYLKKSLAGLYGPELPVVNAAQENLAETLSGLLKDAKRRQELGQLGREYIRKHADLNMLVPKLIESYQMVIGERGGKHAG